MTVMLTEAAASTHEDLRNIKDEIGKYEGMLRHYNEWHRQYGTQLPAETLNAERQCTVVRGLLDVYARQWRPLEKKDEGTIYALIIASVLVEPNFPFVALTDLWHLERRVEEAADSIIKTRFAMLGDREKKDIKPIIEACGNPFNKDNVQRITTVRLLTADHKDEGVSWERADPDPEKQPKAHCVAWTPAQALLCLAREHHWTGSPLSYGTIPAFLPDYLFGPKDKHDKPVAHASDELISSTEAATGGRAGHQQWHIQEDVLEALAWEPDKENTDEALRRALALIRFLIVRNTIRQAEDKDCAFTTAIVERLSKSRGGSNPRSWPTYSFMLNVLKSIALESPYMPQERRARARGSGSRRNL